tara:strand:+ start:594 stop:785 length:192 start_codon:yes stop_codon:yes gene_type:complete
MPGNWTAEKKEAQSQKLKEYWKRRKEQEAQEALVAKAVTKASEPKKPSGFFNSVLGFMKGKNA